MKHLLLTILLLTTAFTFAQIECDDDMPNDYTGDCISYFDNGEIFRKGSFIDGLPMGEVVEYYESGKPKGMYNFQDSTGIFKEYHENGKVSQTGQFVIDRAEKDMDPTGLWMEYDEEGIAIDSMNMDEPFDSGLEELEKALQELEELDSEGVLEEELERDAGVDEFEAASVEVVEGEELPAVEYEIVDFTDPTPTYPGGVERMQNFIASNLQYPREAIEKGIAGKVYLSFVVEPDGGITKIKVERGAHPLLDAEAIRVVEAMPTWEPGYFEGRKVASRCRLPIEFSLEEY